MMNRLTSEDHQRLTEQLENLHIELGCLRQMAGSILERVGVVGAQLNPLPIYWSYTAGARRLRKTIDLWQPLAFTLLGERLFLLGKWDYIVGYAHYVVTSNLAMCIQSVGRKH